ncbi:LysR substrate-binding domain-containing protein [Ferrimonas sp. YFM]|uniref:LysR substrate-binding domain-containing protein n=1 Tax=Ferrimonas sp. YFM TaxID=3028878 RepID=UPI0025734A22|nr:LysR substrate-binding domain-containing protein [Ferrimonas sp. YFM]BDY04535.1 LysR family transcriptional regulator [Ferrimonas sp. YFM]
MVDLSLKQLRLFCFVAQTGNLGVTAERLFLTRGAVSQGIKALESQLGVSLFERQAQRLHLNARGHLLLPLAEQMLNRQASILALFEPGDSQVPLRLGASLTIGNYLLPTLLGEALQQIRLCGEVRLANSAEIQQALVAHQLDLGLIESETLEPELERCHWRDDEMVLIARAGHPLSGQVADWGLLSEETWVLRERHSGSREQFDHHLRPRLKPEIRILELGSLEAVVRSVQSGLGCALVSRLACDEALDREVISRIHLPEPILRRLYIVWGQGNRALPQVASALKLLSMR